MKKIFLALPLVCLGQTLWAQDDAKLIEKAKKIHAKVFTLDTHADTPMRMVGKDFDISKDNSKDGKLPDSKIDFPRMKKGSVDGIFFAVYQGQGPRTPEANAKVQKMAMTILDSMYAQINRHPEMGKIITTQEEALALEKAGKSSIFIGVENGYQIGNDLSYIQKFYDRGARYMTLCHSSNNDICDSSTDPKGPEFNGLSPFGEKVVAEMNRLGMMIDISHLSDSTVWDLIKLSKAPIVATHSDAYAVLDHPRNLNDDLLRAIAKKGGVVQLNLLSSYIKASPKNPEREAAVADIRKKYTSGGAMSDEQMKAMRTEMRELNKKFPVPLATVKDAIDHLDHFVKIMGVDHVGIGGDYDGGGYLADCFDIAEYPNLTIEMVRRGYTEKDLKKIWGENFFRVMKDVQKVGAKIRAGDMAMK
ncbi:dipeptidase [Siphonobacter sp. SORGH_AS_1065]|uniref:dipeptidase n=1 Tax=Siphonobacter sp. SORGH_AS_1065 TaxID=3041795 RepID=UPI002780441A|nr:dipeptidase [Siphonobacter sp. SORGH_AS_1065]MDQ1086001.1 membrane dipeptidase [Siphonobacter sp. SORGH_AS_1065]